MNKTLPKRWSSPDPRQTHTGVRLARQLVETPARTTTTTTRAKDITSANKRQSILRSGFSRVLRAASNRRASKRSNFANNPWNCLFSIILGPCWNQSGKRSPLLFSEFVLLGREKKQLVVLCWCITTVEEEEDSTTCVLYTANQNDAKGCGLR